MDVNGRYARRGHLLPAVVTGTACKQQYDCSLNGKKRDQAPSGKENSFSEDGGIRCWESVISLRKLLLSNYVECGLRTRATSVGAFWVNNEYRCRLLVFVTSSA